MPPPEGVAPLEEILEAARLIARRPAPNWLVTFLTDELPSIVALRVAKVAKRQDIRSRLDYIRVHARRLSALLSDPELATHLVQAKPFDAALSDAVWRELIALPGET